MTKQKHKTSRAGNWSVAPQPVPEHSGLSFSMTACFSSVATGSALGPPALALDS